MTIIMMTGAGADFVMLGGMFAGHDQSGGDMVEKDGKKYKMFYGMSSATAMQRYHGGVNDYRCAKNLVVSNYCKLARSWIKSLCTLFNFYVDIHIGHLKAKLWKLSIEEMLTLLYKIFWVELDQHVPMWVPRN